MVVLPDSSRFSGCGSTATSPTTTSPPRGIIEASNVGETHTESRLDILRIDCSPYAGSSQLLSHGKPSATPPVGLRTRPACALVIGGLALVGCGIGGLSLELLAT
eukprot:scaffold32973_cov31-Tisochrysis_lutea.AAC.7